jgi:hypothetical protein
MLASPTQSDIILPATVRTAFVSLAQRRPYPTTESTSIGALSDCRNARVERVHSVRTVAGRANAPVSTRAFVLLD